jgi:hypothetical protein
MKIHVVAFWMETEAKWSTITLVSYHITTQDDNPEDHDLNYCRGNAEVQRLSFLGLDTVRRIRKSSKLFCLMI